MWGIPEELIQDLREERPKFGVFPENMATVNAFLTVASQWRMTPLALGKVYWQGLDYTAAKAGLDLAQISLTPAQWAGVQLMEDTARAVLNGYRG
ncbi:hypothetical protein CG471_21760 [Sphingobium sp. IP1]|uniref:DUF1799 domain-containing protein n=1 Tax=Sphingobium sp. IP1 TaxID=2021637 RepID=UPI000C079142|nr:DUF1799 domain-containing protein [Sphingobium sp. IP1]PHP17651.1 hypothetical protein CG471_21760 [Sphingobium sp. IP1]